MALRINTNIASLRALQNLQQTDISQRRTLEHLSTGFRINRASDDPSGFVISERLRAQVTSLNQAVENSQNASNLIGTAEAALREVNNLLVQIRESIVFALNSNSAEQIAAEQDAVDNALISIDRIAQTTRFADRKLLDGTSAIETASTLGSGIRDMVVRNAQFDANSSITLSVDLRSVASRAGDVFLSSDGTAEGFRSALSDTVIRITGSKGTQDISLSSGATSTSFRSAVNAFTGNTGIYASGGRLYSVDYGSGETISVQVLSGSFNIGAGAKTLGKTSGVLTDNGVDADATINGAAASAKGNRIRVVSSFFTGDITLRDDVSTGSNLKMKLKKSGLVFQLNTSSEVTNRARVGIRGISASTLGVESRTIPGQGSANVTIEGFLSTIKSGGANDLAKNPANALRIIDISIDQVSQIRAFLGAFQKQTLEANIASLSVASENLASSLSDIKDLDFAAETAEFTRAQILFQAGTSVLAQANQIPQAVLQLLQ